MSGSHMPVELRKTKASLSLCFLFPAPAFKDETHTRTYREAVTLTQHERKIKDTPYQPATNPLLPSSGWPLTLSVERLRQVEGMECSMASRHKVTASQRLPLNHSLISPQEVLLAAIVLLIYRSQTAPGHSFNVPVICVEYPPALTVLQWQEVAKKNGNVKFRMKWNKRKLETESSSREQRFTGSGNVGHVGWVSVEAMTLWCEIASWESLLRRRKAEHRFNLVVNRGWVMWKRPRPPFAFLFVPFL